MAHRTPALITDARKQNREKIIYALVIDLSSARLHCRHKHHTSHTNPQPTHVSADGKHQHRSICWQIV